MLESLASWHVNYLLHSTVLLIAAWMLERTRLVRRHTAWREALWRTALLGGLCTASWQLAWPHLHARPEPTPMVISAAVLPGPAVIAEPATKAAPRLQVVTAPAQPLESSADWRSVASVLTVLWLPLAVVGLVLLGLRWLLLRVQVARLPAHTDTRLQSLAQQLARRAEVRAPQLLLSRRWQSPLVAPGGSICLPEWVTSRLDEAQREAVLAHEVAHLRRRDPAWRLLTQAIVALAWMQPLNRLAARRLDTLAELACDAWAARSEELGRALAESLYVCASQLTRKRAPRLAAAMGQPRSALVARIQTLLESKPMSDEQAVNSRRLPWRRMLLAALLIGGVAAALAPAFVLDEMDLGWHWSGDTHVVASRSPSGDWRIQSRGGRPEFNEDEDEIVKVSGVVTLTEDAKGVKRAAEYTPAPDGNITFMYSVNGKEQALDEAGRAWLKIMVQRAADAMVPPEQRASRLYAKGGVPNVIAWLAKSSSDYQRRAVIQALLQLPEVGPLNTEQLRALLGSVEKMGGDFDRRESYVALIEHQLLGAEQQQNLLAGVASMGSDFDRRTVLEHLSSTLVSTPEVLKAWESVVARIGSDFDRRTSIESLMKLDNPTPAQVDAAIAASVHIGSDFDHRSALIASVPHLVSDAQINAYAQSAGRISGDFDRRESLVAVIERQSQISKAGAMAVIAALSNMGSSFDTTQVLVSLAGHMPNDAELLNAYRARARGLPDHERGQVEKALDRLS
ncbi:MAG: M48 family metalloprotease [Paucibacter sp.]|nr:M48 family metalloprotease [Roseateles sp.]